jgi:hypothetical protein
MGEELVGWIRESCSAQVVSALVTRYCSIAMYWTCYILSEDFSMRLVETR